MWATIADGNGQKPAFLSERYRRRRRTLKTIGRIEEAGVQKCNSGADRKSNTDSPDEVGASQIRRIQSHPHRRDREVTEDG
jgi:hypothetical protein